MHKAGLTKSNPRGPQTEKGGEPSAERNRPARKRGLSSLGIPRKTLSQSVSPVIISLFHHGPAPRSPLHVVRCSIRYNGSLIRAAAWAGRRGDAREIDGITTVTAQKTHTPTR